MAITLMVQVGTSGSFHPGVIRSKIKQNVNTLIKPWREINKFSNVNWFIKLTQDCNFHFYDFDEPLPKNVKAYLVPRGTIPVYILLETKKPLQFGEAF
jgi:hypothetical protein